MADKRVGKLLKQLQAQNWRLAETRNGWMAYSPDGVTKVAIHKTPSDHRWYDNTIRELRKGGFQP